LEESRLYFPKVEPIAGIYRLRTQSKGRSSLYIGESDNLNRRFGNYRNPGPTQQTSLRINRFLIDLLSDGSEASISLAEEASLETENDERKFVFSDKNVRRLFESLAVILEQAIDIENLNR
jgi:hypothetical protein